jgi:long-chain acyl-CoA synthetase
MQHYLSLLQNSVQEHWDAHALCNYKGEVFTFGEFATKMARFHILFEKAGAVKGDKIALCGKNCARWAIAFFSSNTYETVTVPILADFTPESIASLVHHSDAKVLFIDEEKWEKLDKQVMTSLRLVISLDTFQPLFCATDEIQTACNNWDALFNEKYPNGYSKSDVSFPVDNWEDLAIINYTSGTTSAPKGVMLQYASICTNVIFGQNRIPVRFGYTLVSMLPLAHVYGLMFELIYTLCGGCCIYFLGKTPSPKLLLAAMADIKPYAVMTVPLVMEKIFKSSVLPTLNKPAMKVAVCVPILRNVIFKKVREKLIKAFGGNIMYIIMGGAALNPIVESWFKKFKLPYTVGYGMTEAGPLLAYEDWHKFVPKSCGKAVDRCEVRIDSEDPYHVVGEIQARGMNLMIGYYKNESATQAAFTEDGWMKTGDLGVIDHDGNIFIKGRSKNMILSSNGQNIYPEEIEAVLNNQKYVMESVVVDRATKLVALVYLDAAKLEQDGMDAEARDLYLEEMLALANKSLPSYSKLTKVEVVDEPFEKTPKMSIKRFLYK